MAVTARSSSGNSWGIPRLLQQTNRGGGGGCLRRGVMDVQYVAHIRYCRQVYSGPVYTNISMITEGQDPRPVPPPMVIIYHQLGNFHSGSIFWMYRKTGNHRK